MNFFKNNILFFALLFIPGLVFTALLVLSSIYSSKRGDLLGKIDRTHNDISLFKSEMLPFKGLDYDLQLASEDLDSFASVERQQNRLWDMVLAPENNLSQKWSEKSPDKVNSMLTLQYTRLRKLCREKNIVLPGNRTTGASLPFQAQPDDSSKEFGFGMTAYDGNWPNFSKDEAQMLGIQIEIIKELVGYVSKAAISQHPIELVHLRRESVGRTDEKNIAQDQLDLAGRDDSLLRSSLSLKSMSFELCLIGHTPHARTFLNSLSPPYFLRDLIVVREDAGGSTGFSTGTGIDFAPAGPVADDSELPIVQDVRSKFTFLIEYVTSVNRNPDEFFRRVVRKENYNEEMLGEFLLKSGHEKLIKSLIEFLKSADDA